MKWKKATYADWLEAMSSFQRVLLRLIPFKLVCEVLFEQGVKRLHSLGHKAGLDSLLDKRLDFSHNRGKLKRICKADSKIKLGTGEDVSPLFFDGRQVERTTPHSSSLPAIFHHRQM